MELLAPAGNLEKLKAAVRFGAGAVYCAAGPYSLRAPETSFSLSELAAGISFAHQHRCKVYVAMNIFAFDDDLDKMTAYLKEAALLGIDAVIVSDPGVIYRIRQLGIDVKIHLSTQANTTNSAGVKFWASQGVRRIILARELSLPRIRMIKDNAPEMELEILAHGAMCIAYSGRCLLSKFMTGHSANRGRCTQSCRWEYHLRETTRRAEQTICEDTKGTYILNSRDLCMIEHIPEIAAAGIDSIKIEGRMKSVYYVAAVTGFTKRR
jgi:U32 family peptidase